MYSSMHRALDPNSLSKGQRYTPEVVSKLNELVEEHGFSWKLIGQKLGRLVMSFIILCRPFLCLHCTKSSGLLHFVSSTVIVSYTFILSW